jgi:hypothetical protein
MVDLTLTHRLCGVMILISGLLLLLPLPIPFSNTLPALTIVLVAASLLERDGYAFFAGGLMFLMTLAFFAAIFLGGAAVVEWLRHSFGGVLQPDYEVK